MTRNPMATLALSLLLAAAPAWAVNVQTQGEVRYITGGIGLDEVQAIQAQMPNYPLVMEFTEATPKRNRYIAGVEVTISDSLGTAVLAVNSDGPFLLVNLPAGSYKVDATYNGLTKTRKLTVGGKTLRSVWVWPVAGPVDEPMRAPDE